MKIYRDVPRVSYRSQAVSSFIWMCSFRALALQLCKKAQQSISLTVLSTGFFAVLRSVNSSFQAWFPFAAS